MKLATFETITEILPIEGADRIEIARVQGWQSVIRKGDHKVGDRVIFVPIDTVLPPAEWNKHLWNKEDPSKPIRVKTVRLKGAVSQGVIFSTNIAQGISEEDLPNHLAITKYERPVPACLAGQVVGDFPTHLVSKTDEDNLKSNIAVLDELREADTVIATTKIDGSSATYIKEIDGTFRVCSRNMELKDAPGNTHWAMAKKYNIEQALLPGFSLQGELAGVGIQKNLMGLPTVNLFVFNVTDLRSRKPLPRESWNSAFDFGCEETIPVAPEVLRWTQDEFVMETIDSLQAFVNNQKYPNGTPAEGLVFRGYKNDSCMYSKTLQKMLSVKIINQNYKD